MRYIASTLGIGSLSDARESDQQASHYWVDGEIEFGERQDSSLPQKAIYLPRRRIEVILGRALGVSVKVATGIRAPARVFCKWQLPVDLTWLRDRRR